MVANEGDCNAYRTHYQHNLRKTYKSQSSLTWSSMEANGGIVMLTALIALNILLKCQNLLNSDLHMGHRTCCFERMTSAKSGGGNVATRQ